MISGARQSEIFSLPESSVHISRALPRLYFFISDNKCQRNTMTMNNQDEDFHIPSGPDGFKDLLKGLALRSTIHELVTDKLKSGSDVTNEQFALLRAYYPRYVKREDFRKYSRKKLNLTDARAYAGALLNTSLSYDSMLHVIGKPGIDIDDLQEGSKYPNAFIPFLQQLRDLSLTKGDKQYMEKLSEPRLDSKRKAQTPPRAESESRRKRPTKAVSYAVDVSSQEGDAQSETSNNSQEVNAKPQRMASNPDSYPPCADESIVNACCINLLETLAQLLRSKKSKWTLARPSFTAQFKEGFYKAVTDGALYSKDKHIVQAIVEVKPEIRSSILTKVQKQEASEIVAWMKSSTGNNLPELSGQ